MPKSAGIMTVARVHHFAPSAVIAQRNDRCGCQIAHNVEDAFLGKSAAQDCCQIENLLIDMGISFGLLPVM
jgi:hypothetical protein